jgi:predicted transcriptional regulator
MAKQAEDFLTLDAIEMLGVNEETKVNISTRQKVKLTNEFVMLFVENFYRLLPLLKKSEIQVLLCIIRFLNYKNVFAITQKSIAEDTGLDKSSVSNAFKKLKSLKILVETDTGIGYINPYIFGKGSLLEIKNHANKIGDCFADKTLTSNEIDNPFNNQDNKK